MTKCCLSFWSLKCRHGFWCTCIWFLHLTVQYCKPLLMYHCYALPPESFSRWHGIENTLCYLTGQHIAGTRLPPLESPSTENMIWETLAPGWAVITVGSPRECDGDKAACTSCLWGTATQKCLSTSSAISLLLGVAAGARSRARHSSLGLPQLVAGRRRNAIISY